MPFIFLFFGVGGGGVREGTITDMYKKRSMYMFALRISVVDSTVCLLLLLERLLFQGVK